MRRRTIRPSSRHAIVFLVMVLSALVWICWEVGRSRVVRALWIAVSSAVLLFFALGWVSR